MAFGQTDLLLVVAVDFDLENLDLRSLALDWEDHHLELLPMDEPEHLVHELVASLRKWSKGH